MMNDEWHEYIVAVIPSIRKLKNVLKKVARDPKE
jgi:hypothetical protein